jgi:hypothetical protein
VADDDSPGASGATVGALFRAVEDLRDDMREDNGHLRDDMGQLRDDMREDNAALEHRVMSALTDFSAAHGREHATEREESRLAHDRFDQFVRAAELAQARRDGVLGVFRFLLEQTSRHSGPIVRILVTAGGVLAVASGAIRLEVVVK